LQDYEWVISDEDHPKLEPRLLPGKKIHTHKQTFVGLFSGFMPGGSCQHCVLKMFPFKNKMLAPARIAAQTHPCHH